MKKKSLVFSVLCKTYFCLCTWVRSYKPVWQGWWCKVFCLWTQALLSLRLMIRVNLRFKILSFCLVISYCSSDTALGHAGLDQTHYVQMVMSSNLERDSPKLVWNLKLDSRDQCNCARCKMLKVNEPLPFHLLPKPVCTGIQGLAYIDRVGLKPYINACSLLYLWNMKVYVRMINIILTRYLEAT